MMPVDLCASHKHFLDHLLPVWRAIPPEHRGDVYLDHNLIHLIPNARPAVDLSESTNSVLVAGLDDLRRVNGQPAILMEHGAGQSYRGDERAPEHPSYAGGAGRHGVVLFLCPNAYAADANLRKDPGAWVEIIGSPRVADLQGIPAAAEGTRPVVAVTWHWPAMAADVPEAGYAFPHWWPAVERLARCGDFEVIGSAHPRAVSDIRPFYGDAGIEFVASFDEILARANVLVADNTSVMFEWAALRGPTVVLDDPSWRQDVHHGLRFWDAADLGPRILDPAALPIAVRQALGRRPWPGADEILDRVFPPVEDPAGTAARLVVQALGKRPAVPRASSPFPRVARSAR